MPVPYMGSMLRCLSMKLYAAANQCVLKLSPGAESFLKGYATNSTDKPRSAFVDLKGRIVATFEQKILSPDEALIVVGKAFVERLKKHLEKYLLVSETELIEQPLHVFMDLDGDTVPKEGEWVIRFENLAIRIAQPSVILSQSEYPNSVSEEEFTRFRREQNLSLQGVDFNDEFLLKIGDEEFVSYTKGCFFGQEILAKVHHRAGKDWKSYFS